MKEDLPELNYNNPRFSRKTILSAVALIILLIFIPIGVYLVQRTHIFKPKAYQENSITTEFKIIENLNNQLNSAMEAYSRVNLRNKQESLQKLIGIAAQRKERLSLIAHSHPEMFLKLTIFVKQQPSFPEEVKIYIEKEIELEGKLTVIAVDNFEKSVSDNIYVLQTKDKKIYYLNFPKNSLPVSTGSMIIVKGIALDAQVIIKDLDKSLRIVSKALLTTTLEIKLAVILFNFSDYSTQPFSPTQVASILYGDTDSVKSYYTDVSYNKLNLHGNVYGWFTIPVSVNGTECTTDDYYIWGDLATQEAVKQGLDTSQFTHMMYIFPRLSECFFGAVGEFDGDETWINGIINVSILGHELGHNLGLNHANTLDCNPLAIDVPDKCSEREYNDRYDIMGGYFVPYHLNGPNEVKLGWISEVNVQKVVKNGTYKIVPIEKQTSETQILKVQKFYPDSNDYYYIEYRQPLGVDASLDASTTKGAIIHLFAGRIRSPTLLIDPTPKSNNDFIDVSLFDGSTFNDPLNKISITQVSHDDNSVSLEINIDEELYGRDVLGEWKEAASFPVDTINPFFVLVGNYLYSIGGYIKLILFKLPIKFTI